MSVGPTGSLERLRIVVGIVVTIGWIGSVAVSHATGTPVPLEVHGLMALVAGALFGPDIWKRRSE